MEAQLNKGGNETSAVVQAGAGFSDIISGFKLGIESCVKFAQKQKLNIYITFYSFVLSVSAIIH